MRSTFFSLKKQTLHSLVFVPMIAASNMSVASRSSRCYAFKCELKHPNTTTLRLKQRILLVDRLESVDSVSFFQEVKMLKHDESILICSI